MELLWLIGFYFRYFFYYYDSYCFHYCIFSFIYHRYVNMTELQIRWYRQVVEKDVDGILSQAQLLTIIFQLNKVVNHPKQLLIKKDLERGKELTRIQNAEYAGIFYCSQVYLFTLAFFG